MTRVGGVRATLVMFIVLAALVAFVVYSNNAEKAAATPAPSLYVWDVTTDKVASVQIVDNAEQTEITLNRDGVDGWSVKSSKTSDGSEILPEQPADPSQGELAASMVSTLFIQRTLTETNEIREYGLLTPLYTLNIATTDGVELSLGVGFKTPPKDAYYVLRSGDTNAIIVNSGSVDPLLQFLSQPPLATTPTPEVTPTGEAVEGTPTPEP